ncbi:MAG: CCA tRNA nucleotidyltransferase [Boseongicola sp.]|nr:MAG: CCA tRNA nucleotidyltransferase [Boseongicola sp.]
MQIEADWLRSESTQSVLRMLSKAGHQGLVVGGCVRNTILGLTTTDIDIATSARPETVLELAHSAGMKALPTGIEHGTVTVVHNDTPYEITTFREDIETDGRHAAVAFTDQLEKDASRRDLTMNAIYADAEGHVLDPLEGLDDLLSRRIRLIGDPNQRIREDYLRSLRFFRFFAEYGDPALGFDSDALSAISSNLIGMAGLSAERIGGEFRKLLSAADPAPALAAMNSTGVLHSVLPGADAMWIAPLVHLEATKNIAPDHIRRLTALGGTDVEKSLRLSRSESKLRGQLLSALSKGWSTMELSWRMGAKNAWSVLLLKHAISGQEIPDCSSEEISLAANYHFPVTANDLMPKFKGRQLGAELRRLENTWIDSDFSMSRAELLETVRKEG